MSDRMRVQPFSTLLRWILQELEHSQSIFGIHRSQFYQPRTSSPYAVADMFGSYLATPIGPAAGPHTQLAQNILCSWLSGGRFIELKTVQVMDELEIGRPCIDMEDEGYNVEWSQELKLDQSADEYVKAWVLIHILHRILGSEGKVPLGTVFNMSVGYNLQGIQSPPMSRFMARMADASEAIAKIQAVLRKEFPQVADLQVSPRIVNNVTLSTMHGCPPDEIERIVRYLLEEWHLHTTVKLNPTLLGKQEVLRILHDSLGFHEIHIPDPVFEHDLQYGRAVQLIRELKRSAAETGLAFGVKLSNTLAMANHKHNLPGDEMYMSGRALYPITMNLFSKLASEFKGDLRVSFSAGASAVNLVDILAAGARPVTVATDLLKPGGYSRLAQYLERLEEDMHQRGASSLEQLSQGSLANLQRAAAEALRVRRYKKMYHPYGLPKVETGLRFFDCIVAPCMQQCPVLQNVPEYAWWIAHGAYDNALTAILAQNPLPGVTGYICTHLCQMRCTRNNYDEPVAIRALKRFAVENGQVKLQAQARKGERVAIIGAGPSGLAAAYFLALNGVAVTIFESRERAGGMSAIAPAFRIPQAVVQEDIDRITDMGVQIKLSQPVTGPPESLLQEGFKAVYVACGFQKDAPLEIEGIDSAGVWAALDLLQRVAEGERPDLGPKALVVGGGNTAMDAARTARRLTGNPAAVVYRRTRAEMPATEEDQESLLEEGNLLEELASPIRVISRDGRVSALECVRNRLGEPDADGRRRPVPIEGSQFQIPASAIIVAVGQQPELDFLSGSAITRRQDGSISVDPATGQASAWQLYAGGDAVRGPSTVIQACADGLRAAQAICRGLGIEFDTVPSRHPAPSAEDILQLQRLRARTEAQYKPEGTPPSGRTGFDLAEHALTDDAARNEAMRCLQCSTLCDKCVQVCPNRANYAYSISPLIAMVPQLACKDGALVVSGEGSFHIEQGRQIIHIDDFCNDCGNCTTFCVHQGKPNQEKPRLFLDEGDFTAENDNAFHIRRMTGGWVIRRRDGGKESQLVAEGHGDEVVFEDDRATVTLSVPTFQVKAMQLRHEFGGTLSLVGAAEMYAVLLGVTRSLPFLPFRHA